MLTDAVTKRSRTGCSIEVNHLERFLTNTSVKRSVKDLVRNKHSNIFYPACKSQLMFPLPEWLNKLDNVSMEGFKFFFHDRVRL
jgi:hypothetical protein